MSQYDRFDAVLAGIPLPYIAALIWTIVGSTDVTTTLLIASVFSTAIVVYGLFGTPIPTKRPDDAKQRTYAD